MAVAKWVDTTFTRESYPQVLVECRAFERAMINILGGWRDYFGNFDFFMFENFAAVIEIDGQEQECHALNWRDDGSTVVFAFVESSDDFVVGVESELFAFVYKMDAEEDEQQVDLHLLRGDTHEYVLAASGMPAVSLLPT